MERQKPLNPFNLVKCMQQFNKSFFGSTSEITNVDTVGTISFPPEPPVQPASPDRLWSRCSPPLAKGWYRKNRSSHNHPAPSEITSAVIGRDRRHEGTDTMSLGGDDLSFFCANHRDISPHRAFAQHPTPGRHLQSWHLLRLELCITTCHHNKCGRIL